MVSTPALHTDRYELTMLAASLASGTAHKEAVFEVFARKLPPGRGYGVVAGINRLLDKIEQFTFSDEQLTYLLATGAIDEATRDYLTDWRFRGTIRGYRDGELYFPHSPVLTVESTFADAVILETLVLSVLNHDSAIASAAARMVTAARGRTLIEMGSRRTHEEAAVSAATAAYMVGFDASSNLEAGLTYGIPTVGTSAHAFTLAHTSEVEAFTAQVAQLGKSTTLLVDTYDIEQGIKNAVAVAGVELGAIRIDSGDPAEEAAKARELLDELGVTQTKIVTTGDLDEYAMESLADEPIDTYGVGTRLVTGSGHPTAGFVYKLVAIADRRGAPMRPVAKKSANKASQGGRKLAFRQYNSAGHAAGESIIIRHTLEGLVEPGRALQVVMWDETGRTHHATPDQARAHHAHVKAELPAMATALHPTGPYLEATLDH